MKTNLVQRSRHNKLQALQAIKADHPAGAVRWTKRMRDNYLVRGRVAYYVWLGVRWMVAVRLADGTIIEYDPWRLWDAATARKYAASNYWENRGFAPGHAPEGDHDDP